MAGRMAAEAAIRKNSPAMLTKVKGSVGLVPTKMALINRVRTKLPTFTQTPFHFLATTERGAV